ncbi:hypothetical protein [Actinophytocola sp.]|uniref:hypothetical protein n=1 Tax=Actinophytocola sp. TaxID=1872138 RepID=UPI003899FD93
MTPEESAKAAELLREKLSEIVFRKFRSRRELATAADISVDAAARALRGPSVPTAETLDRILGACGHPPLQAPAHRNSWPALHLAASAFPPPRATPPRPVLDESPSYRILPFSLSAAPIDAAGGRAQPGRLLAPVHQVVPFVGRADDLADLAAWQDSTAPFAVRLIHAGGGQGKSRLARHFAGRVGKGWTVWQAVDGRGTTEVTVPAGPVLAVVDYADRWPAAALVELARQLRRLGAQTGSAVRLLLLARSAGYWWSRIRHRLDSDLAAPADARELAPLGDQLDRAALFATASRHFAEALGRPVESVEPPPSLDKSGFRSVLAVHIAALVAVDARRRGVPVPDAPDALSAYLLDRERALWAETTIGTDPRWMGRAVFTAALTGAMPRVQAEAALRAVEVPESDSVLDDHAVCYPPGDPREALEPLYPDRLAEDFIGLMIPGHVHADSSGWPDGWTTGAVSRLLAVEPAPWTGASVRMLVETARRWRHVADEVLYPMLGEQPGRAVAAGGASLVRLAALPGVPPGLLYDVAMEVPFRHVDLDLGAAAITASLVRSVDPGLADRDPITYAALLRLLADRQLAAGEAADALTNAQEAVRLLRGVADQAAVADDLASALNILGSSLMANGARVAAARALQEGIAAGPAPAVLATLSVNLARILVETDEVADAEALARSAVDYYRDRPADVTDLAVALNNLSIARLSIGKAEPAASDALEAVTLLRPLAVATPDEHLPNLAMAMNNLAVVHTHLGRHDEALTAAAEAAGVHRRLAAINPAYRAHLVRCVLNLAMCHRQLEQLDAAADAAEEALALARLLAADRPQAHDVDVVNVLEELARQATIAGRPEQAVSRLDEASDIVRRRAAAEPGRYRARLARLTGRRCLGLFASGRPADAHAAAAELADLVASLTDEEVAGPDDGLGSALTAAATTVITADRENRRPLDVALRHQVRRLRLAVADPAELAQLLLAEITAGSPRQSFDALQEAVAALRPTAAADPAHRRALGLALTALGLAWSEQPQRSQSIGPADEAVRILRSLPSATPEHQTDLLLSLTAQAHCGLVTNRTPSKTLASADEAIEIYDRLPDRDRKSHQEVHRRVFGIRGTLLARLGPDWLEHRRSQPRDDDAPKELLIRVAPGSTTTLDQIAAKHRCSVEGVRRLLADVVDERKVEVRRTTKAGPVPVDLRTLPAHARFEIVPPDA